MFAYSVVPKAASAMAVAPPTMKDEGTQQQQRKPARCVSPSPSTETILTGSKKRGRVAKNCVSFHENVRVRRTITLDEFTEEEILATWFQKEEFDLIKRKIVMLARKVERDGAQLGPDKNYCIRGLESLLSGRSEKKAEARAKVAQAVLFEQEKQYLANSSDEQAIATASIRKSAESQLLAVAVGHSDQREAYKIYRSAV
jgi:hypothetical protein